MITEQKIIELAKSKDNQVVVVACPYDEDTVKAVKDALSHEICKFIFVGEESQILNVVTKEFLDEMNIKTYFTNSTEESAKVTMELLSKKEANVLMKGLIDTSVLLKEMFKKEYGLRLDGLLSHVGILMKPGEKTVLVTDGGINIAPDLKQKKEIIKNAVKVAHALGMDNPVVGNICAKEKPYDKMPATLDAAALQKMNEDGEITGCLVSGPLQVDNAVSIEACKIKGVKDPACGKVDIFMMPTIEAGNVFVKTMTYLAGYEFYGVVIGAKIPVILVSRADEAHEKLMSIAIANCI